MYRKSAFIMLVALQMFAGMLLTLVSCGSQPSVFQPRPTATIQHGGDNSASTRLLVFSKTGAFRHASIPDAIVALRKLAAEHQVTIDFTEDATVFTDANLAHYKAVIF